MNRLVPLILAVALFMENMDATVIATSLPAIAADIGTSPVALKLAFTAYFVALAIFIPVSAWMADRLGAKNVFRAAIVVFVTGSVLCALSGSLQEFVFARFLKGVGGAMMAPLARLILFRSTPKSELVNAMAWLTIPAVVAPMVGPPVGGFLTTYLSWHWIFIVNVPIGLFGLVLVSLYLPDIPSEARRPLDLPGFILIAMAFSGIIFGLSLVSLPILPLWMTIASLIAGIAAMAVYLLHARRTANPILDPTLFRKRTFSVTIIGTVLFLVGVGAIPFLLPLMLQLSFGMTPFESGLVVFVSAVGAFIAKFWVRRLYAAVGFRTALSIAAFIAAIGIMAHGLFAPETPILVMMLVIFVAGLARASYFTGQNALVLSDIESKDAGPATAISTITRPIGTALGVALAGGLLEISAHIRGEPLALIDFHIAFYIVGFISALGALPYLFLSRDAGSVVSGHVSRAAREETMRRAQSEGTEGPSPRI